jgi:hypothetical protein
VVLQEFVLTCHAFRGSCAGFARGVAFVANEAVSGVSLATSCNAGVGQEVAELGFLGRVASHALFGRISTGETVCVTSQAGEADSVTSVGASCVTGAVKEVGEVGRGVAARAELVGAAGLAPLPANFAGVKSVRVVAGFTRFQACLLRLVQVVILIAAILELFLCEA